MYYGDGPAPSSGVVPAQDLNPKLSFNIPPEYTANVPGFLQVLFDELDKVREESSLLWADLYPPIEPVRKLKSRPYQSNIRREMGIRQQLDILSEKENVLMAQVQELRWLLKPENTPQLGQE